MNKILLSSVISAAALFLVLRGTAAQPQGEQNVNIQIISGGIVITAELNDSPAARDLISKLPLRLKFYTHQNREFYTDINLSTSGRTQNGYTKGDIAYWTPGKTLVLFYDEGYTGSLIKMGTITSSLEELAQMPAAFTAEITRSNS